MRRLRSASQRPTADSKSQQRQQQAKRGGSAAAPRRAIVSEPQDDEMLFYTQRLKEIAIQQAKLEREYQQRFVINRRLIRQMHDENTHLRTIRSITSDVTAAELEQLEKYKFLEIRRLNRLTHQLEKIEGELKFAEETNVSNNNISSELPRDSVSGNCSVALRIKKLEKQLDQTLFNQRRVVEIRKVYVGVLEELQEKANQRGSPVEMLERDIEARRRDYAKLVLMYNNALSDYRYARQKLRKFGETFQQARQLKDKALAERREKVERALRETQRLELREEELQQEIGEEQQRTEETLAAREAHARRRRMSLGVVERLAMAPSEWISSRQDAKYAALGRELPGDEERLQAYDNSFRKMIHATESSSINDLMTKIEVEYASRLQLKNEIREEEFLLEQLRLDVENIKEKTQQRLLCGVPKPLVTPSLIEDLAIFLENETHKRDAARQRSAHLQEIFLEVTQRVDVLAKCIESYRKNVSLPPTQEDNLMTNMQLLEQKILSLADDVVRRGETQNGVISMLVVLPESNTRVKLPNTIASSPVCAQNANPARVAGGVSTTLDDSTCGILPSTSLGDFDVSVLSDSSDSLDVIKDGSLAMSLLDNNEPLTREQIKRLATVVVRREARQRQREERR